MAITISTTLADNSTNHQLKISYTLPGSSVIELITGASHTLDENLLSQLVVTVVNGGHWGFYGQDVDCDQTIQFDPLPSGPQGWWHVVHGVDQLPMDRGRGVKIGVIDLGMQRQSSGSGLAHVQNIGLPGLPQSSQAFQPAVDHGLAVTSLIANRPTTQYCFEGIAPGAEVVFASAVADGSSTRLDPSRVSDCVQYLSFDENCDFINISAGELKSKTEAIRNAVIDAWDEGTVCLFASGNSGNPAPLMYPACYLECLTVAACGQVGFAPTNSFEKEYELNSTKFGSSLYSWCNNTLGNGVDFLAGGSNIIWSNGKGKVNVGNGTSYAAPIATGLAAVICARDSVYNAMPRDRTRSTRALELMKQQSMATGLSQIHHGLISA